MPCRNAHWWVVVILTVTAAFWRDYFGVHRKIPFFD